MAAITELGTRDIDTTAGNDTVTATPAVNDLIVVVQVSSNSAATGHNITDDQAGGTYTQIALAQESTNGKRLRMWVRNSLIASAVSTVFTSTISGDSGGGLGVFKVTGMSKVGLNAIRQSAIQDEQAASTTPAPVFGSAVLTTNPVLGCVMNGTNPATLTPRSSPAYTERFDVGYINTTIGVEVMSIEDRKSVV